MRKSLVELLHRKEQGDSVRIWVPGCATGEEVYSIAILVAEELGADLSMYRVQIFGTDINDTATQFARRGVYPEAALAHLDERLLHKYFSQQDRMYCVDRRLKDITVFARQDLVQDPPFVRDMVSCRNLLIYFKSELQDRVLRIFHYALQPHGVLFLGKSENIGQSSTLFIEKGRKNKLFSRRDVPTPMFGNFSRMIGVARGKRQAEAEVDHHAPSEMARTRLHDIYTPATILVSADGDILEFLGDCSPFIKVTKGRADFNLFSTIHSAFRSELRAFAHRVGRSKTSVAGQPTVIKLDGEPRLYRMAVHYVGTDTLDHDLLMVCFERMPDRPQAAGGDDLVLEEAAAVRITELEHELTLTRENLQTVVEELETSNEELQALNEEAQAANEELQASNEELETSNEELQATNEELTTVNDELFTKTEELSGANDDLENILDSVLKALVVVDQKLRITRHNKMALRFFAFPSEERLPNLTTLQVLFDLPDVIGMVRGVVATGQGIQREFDYDDSHYILTISPYVTTHAREVWGAILTFDDITERKRAEEKLRLSASVFDAASEATLITDSRNQILSVNPAFTRITGYTLAEVIGQSPAVLASGRHDGAYYQAMWRTLLETGHWQGEIWNRRKGGEIYPEWLSISLLRDDNGKVLRHIAVFSDITDDKKAQEIIKQQANYDGLTSLPNRNLFFDRVQQTIHKSARFRQVFGLLFIDLDGFKGVNDTLGHGIGDKLLKEVATRLTGAVRESDTVGRLGGDEFTVLLNQIVSVTDVAPIADKILSALAQPYKIDGHTVHVSGSAGITVYPDDGTTIEALLKNADSAMYASKAAGRNTFRFFTMKMQEEVEKHHRLANDLKNALLRKEFFLHYQPILDLRQRRVVGAEALLRWEHPTRGMVSPAEFIPICEEIGIIGEIGLLVVEQACAAVMSWQKAAGMPVRVMINRSAREFHMDAVCSAWNTVFEESKVPSHLMGIEITESVMLADTHKNVEYLTDLRKKGHVISLDDFGTGYSSLSYLKRLPIDTLKIDRSFISDLEVDNDDVALIEAILSMARGLGIRVVAEGIETAGQRDFLIDRGCDYGQGYFFSRPIPNDKFMDLLAAPSDGWWAN
jgi:two-component system CheB/CheR fusion protein